MTHDLIKRTNANTQDAVPDLTLPISEEQYRLLTENPFPYMPDVYAQLSALSLRMTDAMQAEARLWQAWNESRKERRK